MSHQDDASELGERLGDVEVAERTDLEESDAQLLRVHLRLLRGHLTLVGQVEAVPNQDLRNPRGMLGKQGSEKGGRFICLFFYCTKSKYDPQRHILMTHVCT